MNVIPSIDPSSNVTDCRFHSFFLGGVEGGGMPQDTKILKGS